MTEAIPKGYKQTKVGVIPEDWDVKRIREISIRTKSASPEKRPDWIFDYIDVS